MVWLLDFFSYFVIDMTSISFELAPCIICSLIYTVSALVVVYYWILASTSDPSDPTIKEERLAQARCEWFDATRFEFMCEVCDTHVMSSSKHCGACNRCVNDFDHHCFWINNCVGSKNYRHFFKLIIAAFTMTLIHNLTNAVVIYMFMTENVEVRSQHLFIFERALESHFLWVLWVAVFFNLMTFCFLGHLIHFHIYIQKEGITTYEWIKRKENRVRQSRIIVRVKEKDPAADSKNLETKVTPATRKETHLKRIMSKLTGFKLGRKNTSIAAHRDDSPHHDPTGDSNQGKLVIVEDIDKDLVKSECDALGNLSEQKTPYNLYPEAIQKHET